MAKKRDTSVLMPNWGLYLDRAPISVPARGLQDGVNFRIASGKISTLNIGWTRFAPDVQLNGPVKLISNFFLRDGTERLIFGTPTDLYRYDSASKSVTYLTPTYATGTVAVDAADPAVVTGTGTLWGTNAKVGDKISFGSATQNSVTATWYTIATVNDDDTLTLSGPVAGAPISAGTAYTIRKVFTGDILTTWDAETFLNDGDSGEDVWVATNGLDPIVKWDGSAMSVSDAGLPFRCKVLAVYSNMMIYGNLIQSGDSLSTSIINSDVGKPLNVSGGLSEQFVVHSGSDGIIEMMPLGDYLVIYCKETGVMVQFVGDPTIFLFRRSFSGLGPLGADLIADFGSHHEFLGKDSQYRFDGGAVTEINMHVWRDVLLNRDPTREGMGFTHFDNENADLIWALPLQSDTGAGTGADGNANIGVAHSEHYLEQPGQGVPTPYSRRQFPFTTSGYFSQQEGLTWESATDNWNQADYRWDEQFTFLAFPLNLTGDASGKLYTINTSQRGDNVNLASFVRFGRRALGDGRMRGLLSRVYPFASSEIGDDGTIRVRVYASDHASGPSVLVSELDFSLDLNTPAFGMAEHAVKPYRRGRYMELEIGSLGGEADAWSLDGYDVDVKPGGMR